MTTHLPTHVTREQRIEHIRLFSRIQRRALKTESDPYMRQAIRESIAQCERELAELENNKL